ncbi:MAG: hypothetical protein COC01_03385 [Bacteroidetes bacterium]|nr:MAG: hypothetical protein COC01_03385 [Bacteroidota bacterium]
MLHNILIAFLILFGYLNVFCSGIDSLSQSQFYEKVFCDDDRLYYSNKHIVVDGEIYLTGYSRSSSAQMSDVLFMKIDSSGSIEWLQEFGGIDFDEGFDLIFYNNHFYVCGIKEFGDTTIQGDIALKLTQYYLLKFNKNGQLLWKKTYKVNSFGGARNIVAINDTIILGGVSSNSWDCQYNVVLTDTSGNKIGQMEIGTSCESPNTNLIKTNDGRLVLLELKEYNTVLTKLTSSGVLIWTTTYENLCSKIIELSQGGYIMIGSKKIWSESSKDIHVVRLGTLGGIQWQKKFGSQSYSENVLSIIQQVNGDFLLGGYRLIYELYNNSFLFSIDLNGDSIWYKEYGQGYRSEISSVSEIAGEFVGCGYFFKNNNASVYLINADSLGSTDTSYCYEPMCIPPEATYSYGGTAPFTITFINYSKEVSNNYWDFGDGEYDTITNPVHTYSDTGYYNVCLFGSNDCSTDTSCKDIYVMNVGINNGYYSKDDIGIYPNPAISFINISLKSQLDANAIIYNLIGETIYEIKHSFFVPLKIDIASWKSGVYFLQLQIGDGIISKKIIINH